MKSFRNKVIGESNSQVTPRSVSFDQTEIKIKRLVERAAGGDVEAFGELYIIYVERIYRYVFYQVKDKMTAEDIVQDVFIKAWRAIDSCRGKEKTFSAWLYSIAHNHVIDVFRRRQKELSTKMESMAEVSDHRLEIEAKFEHQRLLEVIDCLPPNQKQVVILKFIEGLNNHEIGQVIHKNQGAIRILQMRALAMLRRKLSRENQG